ncbi:MAG: DNA mismatch repair protein MutS [Chloroflexi bacterium]|nr:DNA mismatch repair protein MutS [Chloroflexota bacterium]
MAEPRQPRAQARSSARGRPATAPSAPPPTPRRPLYGELVSQYLDLRDNHLGVLILFRVGSFYEVLFEDAELVSRELGLKLTERPSGGAAPPVSQCGFAHHALDTFLTRLLARGYRVAVCEEREDEPRPPATPSPDAADDEPPMGNAGGSPPASSGPGPGSSSGGVRQRDIVRTLTPGTVTDPRLLREDRPTYLVAVAPLDDRLGLAWTDVAAGEFKAAELSLEEAAAELQRLEPAEVIVSVDRPAPDGLLAQRSVTPVGPSESAVGALQRAFPEADLTKLPAAEIAAGLIVGYLEETQGADVPVLDPPTPAAADETMRLDAVTQRHLELVETERARERTGSLLGTLDRTVTPMGRRMLRGWLLRPLVDVRKIAVRQAIVAELVGDPALRASLAERLAAVADLERLAGRASARKATLDDLRTLGEAAGALPLLAETTAACRSPFLRALGRARPALARFAEQARTTLAAGPADVDARGDRGDNGDGPFRASASPALAEALGELRRARRWQGSYVERLRRLPGLARVKLDQNSTQGLFLEVPLNTRVPADWIRRGGLQKVERYSTAELDAHAQELSDAESLVAAETRVLLADLREAAAATAGAARDLARHLAAADALLALALVAAERGWVQPTIDAGDLIEIVGGRHPVVEALGPFQPNDARLVARGDGDQLVILTGPNMAGKSTWMRQLALIVLLAQAGSFVPARAARIGLVDGIYTRIGAVDDLAGGRSTFMVEMEETATVLRAATDRSLLVLDEIGRGTSTHDGMAIAWSVAEYLATGPVRPRAVVATHYHELAALADVHPQVTLLRATVEERPEGIAFPHVVEAGAADRSFGIEVARLAGLPPALLARAREVADAVEPLSAEVASRLSRASPPGGPQTST